MLLLSYGRRKCFKIEGNGSSGVLYLLLSSATLQCSGYVLVLGACFYAAFHENKKLLNCISCRANMAMCVITTVHPLNPRVTSKFLLIVLIHKSREKVTRINDIITKWNLL